MIEPVVVRTLTLREPSRPGRPAHVSAASGLVRAGGKLYVVVDDENHLAIFDTEGAEPGTLKRIFAGVLPNDADARKRHKPDVECAVRLPAFAGYDHGALLVLGSGSQRHRCHSVLLAFAGEGALGDARLDVDFTPLHDALDAKLGGLNIEGAVVLGNELVLLQRGGRGGRPNARIRIRLQPALDAIGRSQRLGGEALIAIEEVELGGVGNIPYAFTDGAALPDGRMLFTTIAEDAADSYVDGPCCGAAIGIMDAAGRIDCLEALAATQKVEGIDVVAEGGTLRALLVTDADDFRVPSTLLACEIRA